VWEGYKCDVPNNESGRVSDVVSVSEGIVWDGGDGEVER